MQKRFFHLGERIEIVGKIKSGEGTIETFAKRLGVSHLQIIGWLKEHAEGPVWIEDIARGRPEGRRLKKRIEGLREALSRAEAEVVRLHLELVLQVRNLLLLVCHLDAAERIIDESGVHLAPVVDRVYGDLVFAGHISPPHPRDQRLPHDRNLFPQGE